MDSNKMLIMPKVCQHLLLIKVMAKTMNKIMENSNKTPRMQSSLQLVVIIMIFKDQKQLIRRRKRRIRKRRVESKEYRMRLGQGQGLTMVIIT